MNAISIHDFVIAKEQIGEIVKCSVGLMREMNDSTVTVFFVGTGQEAIVHSDKLETIDVKRTGKGYEKKICNICHVLKEANEFDINQTDAKGRKTTRPSCKSCRVYIDGHRLRTKERKRLDAAAPRHVFTCPICQKTTIVGVTANLVRDHDHETGNAREWICDSCNTGLGRFKDDIGFLKVAIAYLERHNARSGGH